MKQPRGWRIQAWYWRWIYGAIFGRLNLHDPKKTSKPLICFRLFPQMKQPQFFLYVYIFHSMTLHVALLSCRFQPYLCCTGTFVLEQWETSARLLIFKERSGSPQLVAEPVEIPVPAWAFSGEIAARGIFLCWLRSRGIYVATSSNDQQQGWSLRHFTGDNEDNKE